MAIREVNFIPLEILHSRYVFRHLQVWLVCLLVALGLSTGIYIYQIRSIMSEKDVTGRLSMLQSELKAKIEEINLLKTQLEKLREQHAEVSSITRTNRFSNIVAVLSSAMNSDTWLKQLTITRQIKDDDNNLSLVGLTGSSLSNEKLGDFLKKLSRDTGFKDVLLKYAREQSGASATPDAGATLNLIEFYIECSSPKG
ncbi:MAG: PilN domain-containing protein [Pseudomonadota bacterium]